MKKARKAGLLEAKPGAKPKRKRSEVGRELLELAEYAQQHGWSAEELLLTEVQKRERALRKKEGKSKIAEKAMKQVKGTPGG